MSAIITKYLGNLKGIEVGRGTQNNYNLSAIAVDCKMHALFDAEQMKFGHSIAPIDIIAEADAIPLPDSSQDYVFSSHVLEHLVDPIGAIIEWYRLVKNKGYIALVIPHRNAAPSDQELSITTVDELLKMHEHPVVLENTMGHLTRWTPISFCNLIHSGLVKNWWNLDLKVVQDPDDQIGNGMIIILEVKK